MSVRFVVSPETFCRLVAVPRMHGRQLPFSEVFGLFVVRRSESVSVDLRAQWPAPVLLLHVVPRYFTQWVSPPTVRQA